MAMGPWGTFSEAHMSSTVIKVLVVLSSAECCALTFKFLTDLSIYLFFFVMKPSVTPTTTGMTSTFVVSHNLATSYFRSWYFLFFVFLTGWERAFETARLAKIPHLLYKEQWEKKQLQVKHWKGFSFDSLNSPFLDSFSAVTLRSIKERKPSCDQNRTSTASKKFNLNMAGSSFSCRYP